MLGNQVELWETMLAAMKLGAVVIPATTLLAESDLRDRIDRGRARHVIVRAADAGKFDGVPGNYTRIAVGGARRRLARLLARVRGAGAVRARRRHPRVRHAAAVLHVRHDRAAEARRAHARVLSGRAPLDDVLARPQARRRAPELELARAGPSTRGRTSSRPGSPRRRSRSSTTSASTPRALLDVIATRGVTTFCAPPTVWRMLIQADLASVQTGAARGRRRRRAAEPRGHRAGASRPGA